MRYPFSLALGALLALVPAARAQVQSMLFVIDDTCSVYSPLAAHAATGRLIDDEIGFVTPIPGSAYGARPFLSVSTQWVLLGDHDADGDFVESSTAAPGNEPDAILIHRLGQPPATYGPRDVFLSKAADLTGAWADGDVFRFPPSGGIEFFLYELQILTAIGQMSTDNVDLDAICMDSAGALFLSFNGTELVNGVSAEDGAIIHIPAAAITYAPTGNVSAIALGSAVVLAHEADVTAMIVASGVRDAQGTAPPVTSTDVEVSALEIDPNGGTFTSPVDPNLVVPNLLFAWDDTENDGAVLSTASGGSIASINGVPMGSAEATTGLHLGLIPRSTGTDAVFALGLIPAQAPLLVLENWPVHSYSTTSPLFARQEVTGATAGGVVVFLADAPVGSAFPTMSIPGYLGDYYGLGIFAVVGFTNADANGNAANMLDIPATIIGSGFTIVWQVLDLGAARFGWPGATDF